MIIIGEKINGAIPSIKQAIEDHNEELIQERVAAQAAAGADYIDCAPSTAPEIEYDTMVWLIDLIQDVTDLPISIDSPNPLLLKRIIEEGRLKRPGMVNSVNEEGTKCETLFPLIAGTDWNVIGLTCDKQGIPMQPDKKLEIAKSIIDKADHFGVKLSNLHIDPCVMALATAPTSMDDFAFCIKKIQEIAPEVKVTGALSNVSFNMPARKYVNAGCMTVAVEAGLDSAIMDPCSSFMMGTLYYVLYLIIMGKVPQVFYVAEISWLAAYLFFLSLSLSRRDLHGKLPGVVSVLGAVVIVCLVMAFQIFGPSLFFSGCFGITAGTIVLRCMEVLRREKEHHLLDGIMLLVAWLQVLLYIVSEFIKDYTRFNLYFAVDITLTLTMAYLFFALRKEVERG